MMRRLLIASLLFPLLVHAGTAPDALLEKRYCGPPTRTASGDILRRADVLRAFKQAHRCPSTGLYTGDCPGWAMDHVVPLACGGCDAVWNLQWLPNDLKSDAGEPHDKDRFERKVYESKTPIPGTTTCHFQLVP
jgi:5-methylcytosine-specific restriction endonuclease McrA